MNIENLDKLIAVLEGLPTMKTKVGFSMSFIFYAPMTPDRDRSGHNCDTVACIAGWCNIAKGTLNPNFGYWDLPKRARDHDLFGNAAEWLGLPTGEAHSLFYPDSNKPYTDYTLEDALKVLYNLKDTGRVDWSIVS